MSGRRRRASAFHLERPDLSLEGPGKSSDRFEVGVDGRTVVTVTSPTGNRPS